MNPTHDVVVVGGGFAGAALALLLKRARPETRVAVIEGSERFPRKVGESATELSTWFLTRVLGLDRHLAIDHLPKHGLRFWFTDASVHSLPDASELGNRYQSRIPGLHVERAALDENVLELAARQGAEILRPARVREVAVDAGPLARLDLADGSTLHARWVVDGSGRRAWLARQLDVLQPNADHPVNAYWARYRGVRDFDDPTWLPGRLAGRTGVHCSRGLSTNHLTGRGWWLWVIPLPGGEVSIGLLWDERLTSLPPGDDLGARFDAFARADPLVRELLAGAERTEPFHALKHLPYRVSRIMGSNWALVGDAAGFLDPLYSPGMDYAGLTVLATASLLERSLRGEDIAREVARHNRHFTRAYARSFEALYRDKYEYVDDFELMRIALRMDTAGYYLGVITPAYRPGLAQVGPPFGSNAALPFYWLMRFVNRRLVRLSRARRALGVAGARNHGRRDLLPGFVPGPGNLLHVGRALGALGWLELKTLVRHLAARPRPAPAPVPDRPPA